MRFKVERWRSRDRPPIVPLPDDPVQDGQQAGQPRRPDEARKAAPGPEPRGHHKLVYKRTGIAAAIVHATIGAVVLLLLLRLAGRAGWRGRWGRRW